MKIVFENKEDYHTPTEKKYITIAYEYYKKNNVNPVKVNRKTFYFEDEKTVVIDPIKLENGYKGRREKFLIKE